MSQTLPISQSTRLSPVYVAAAGQTQFDAGFPAQAADDLIVYSVDADGFHTTPWALNTDYTVTNLAPATDAQVVFNPGLSAGTKLRIAGWVVKKRLSNITVSGKYRSQAIEGDLDLLTMIAQEHDSALDGALRAQPGETLDPMPPLADMAGKVVAINAAGDAPEAGPTADEVSNAQGYATAAQAAQTGAETARTGAETAETNAETAETNADTAETGAVAAQGLAEDARDAAIAASENLAYGYEFDTGTADADPGAAKVRFNHATFASATFMYINETAAEGDLSALMDVWDDSTSDIKATVKIRNPLAPTNWFEFYVDGAITDAGTYRKVPITPIAANGSIADGTDVLLGVFRNGDAGTGAVDSCFGRSGVVVALVGDYSPFYGRLGSPNTWTGKQTFAETKFSDSVEMDLPGYVGDGGNDYGPIIKSYEPAITLVDKTSGKGQAQVRAHDDGAIELLGDSVNDGTIGHNTNTTDFSVAKFSQNKSALREEVRATYQDNTRYGFFAVHRQDGTRGGYFGYGDSSGDWLYIVGDNATKVKFTGFTVAEFDCDVIAERYLSERVTIADDAVAEITTPNFGGIVMIMLDGSADEYPAAAHSGIYAYDTGTSLALTSLGLGASATNQGSTVLTGTTGPDGKLNVSVKAGALCIENRLGTLSSDVSITFIGGR